MTQPRPDRSLKLRAIVIALVVFAVLHALLLVGARALIVTPGRAATMAPILNVAAYFMYLIAGFTAGACARNAPILHGVTAGLFAAILAILFFGSSQADMLGSAVLIANGMIFGGIGGACSLFTSQETPKDA